MRTILNKGHRIRGGDKYLVYRFRKISFKKLLYRQKLARMMPDNKRHEAKTQKEGGKIYRQPDKGNFSFTV